MTDYLLVHGPGQGSWVWGKVWGRMTAPVEHPPTLHKPRRANRVHTIDLPGHGPDAQGDTAAVRLEECVNAIIHAVEQEQLKDVVLAGYGISGGIVLEAARQLPAPPKRLALVGAAVPAGQRPLISACANGVRSWFQLSSLFSALSRREFKFSGPVINRFLCNTMETMEIVQILGFFGPIPTRLLKSGLSSEAFSDLPAPLTCIVLTEDKLVTPSAQRRTAERLNSEETLEIDACHMAAWQKPEALANALLRYA